MRNRLITFAGFLAAICLLLGWIRTILRPTFEFGSGSGGIGAVSAGGLSILLLLLTILGLVLAGLWTVVRALVHALIRKTDRPNP
jgi:hypothetical protein